MTVLILLVIVAFVSAQASLFRQVKSTNGWTRVGDADPEDKVRVTVGVKQNNLDVVDRLFWEISDPSSPKYTQYLTHEELGALTKNTEGTKAVVMSLLEAGAVNVELSTFGEFVSADLTASTVNTLFNTKVSRYSHSMFDEDILKSEGYVVPENLLSHMTHVAHLTYFPGERVNRRAFAQPLSTMADEKQPALTTPELITKVYNIDDTITTTGKSTQSLFEALGQNFSPSDLGDFQRAFHLELFPVERVIGPNDRTQCVVNPDSCGEANLDVQYMMAIAQKAPTTYWDIPAESQDPFTDWVAALAATENPPFVHSISYGGYEDEIDEDAVRSFNTEIQKLSLRGVTVVVSSGDDGVANSLARDHPEKCGYFPSFPATSPYVTSIGATQGPEEGRDEVACSSDTGGLITTGGGFSDVFNAPSYQLDHVDTFFQQTSPAPVGGYNMKGRGIPDVSAMGHNFPIQDGGQWIVVSGTSASAPVFGAMITLINDARIADGKKPLGFLNQALYAMDKNTWNDVTSGNNKCTAANADPVCCEEGFSATSGWDPVSGLGTPKFDRMKEAFMSYD